MGVFHQSGKIIFTMTYSVSIETLTLRRPLLPYGYNYKASCGRLG